MPLESDRPTSSSATSSSGGASPSGPSPSGTSPSGTADTVTAVLARTRRIAVVGASDDPNRPSYGVVRRLVAAGYEVVPVTPSTDTVQGMPTVASLADVPGPIDLVDVFRRIDAVPDVARQAAEVGAAALWLQSGLRSPEARRIAEDAGMDYVEDACLGVVVDVARHRAVAGADGA